MYHTTQEIDELFGGPPTTLTHIPRMTNASPKLINPFDTAPDNVFQSKPSGVFKTFAKRQTKIRGTSYKKEMAAFLKQTATKKFGEVFEDHVKYHGTRHPSPQRIQSRKNWKKYCVKVYEADFKKECMLEVGGKFFLKPATIPENDHDILLLCDKFHRRIEEEHGKPVPENAGLRKATFQRFYNMRKI